MGVRIEKLTNWLGSWFTSFVTFLECIGRPVLTKEQFVNLAQTDKAEKNGVSTEDLLFATADLKVNNISLNRLYGSEKAESSNHS